jgi:hypothetical protein
MHFAERNATRTAAKASVVRMKAVISPGFFFAAAFGQCTGIIVCDVSATH